MTDTALTVRNDDLDTIKLGKLIAASGYFTDARDMAQAVVKVLAGRELGLGPIASMSGVYIVKGKPSLSANLLAGVLKRSGKYNYRVLTPPADRPRVCEIAFYERNGDKWDEIGRSVFTAEDARRAGTQNMDKFPANMLFARAMTNGIRWYCPDVFAGGVYTPEEMGASVDSEGQVIEVLQVTSAATVVTGTPAPNGNPMELPRGNGHKTATAKLVVGGELTTAVWQSACAGLVKACPRYANTDGTPNYHHITGAAKKEGFSEINSSNYASVIEALAARPLADATETKPEGAALADEVA